MKNIAIMYGGDSVEADVSIITGTLAISGISMTKYKAYAIYIRDSKMWLVDSRYATEISTYTNSNVKRRHMREVILENGKMYYRRKYRLKYAADIDCAVLATHGGNGENGSLQGHLEMNNIPYTSCDVTASSICMDKALMHRLTSSLGIGTVKYTVVQDNVSEARIDKIFDELGGRVIVKPNSLGSSVGVKLATGKNMLHSAVADAFRYDSRILLEQCVDNLVEANCGVVRTADGIIVSEVDVVDNKKEIFDYDDKYINSIPQPVNHQELPTSIVNKISSWTRKVYSELGLAGVVRIDYLYDSGSGKLYLNEINTIPGSLAYYLFDSKGMDMTDILTAMIDSAISRREQEKNLVRRFSSSILAIRENSSAKLLQKIRK